MATDARILCIAIARVEELVWQRLGCCRTVETLVVDREMKQVLDYLDKQIDTRRPTFLEKIVRNARSAMEGLLPTDQDFAKSIRKLEIMQEKWTIVRFGEYWSRESHHDVLYGTEPYEWSRPRIGLHERTSAAERQEYLADPDVERMADTMSSEVNDTVRNLAEAKHAFEYCTWTKICGILKKEKHLVNVWASEHPHLRGPLSSSPITPMHKFLEIISTFIMEWSFLDVYQMIQEFVSESMVQHPWILSSIHSTRERLVLAGDVEGLARQLRQDFEDLCLLPAKLECMDPHIEARIINIWDHHCLDMDWDEE